MAAELACLFEVSGDKPGNVTWRRGFADTVFEDYLASAVALGRVLGDAGKAVGETVYRAVELTRCLVPSNTNLGIILLLVPLALSYCKNWRSGLQRLLQELTMEDAQKVYAAIELVEPGGLGVSVEGDIHGPPPGDLLAAMATAAERDSVAREYVTDYRITFEVVYPGIKRVWEKFRNIREVVTEVYLETLAGIPDTLIARKNGLAEAQAVSSMAADVVRFGGVHSSQGRLLMQNMDLYLRSAKNNRLNPGTTADLVTAGLFVAILNGDIYPLLI